MLLNGFSVRIANGVEESSGYVSMRHGQVYQIQLRNNNSRRCDAQIEVDGKVVGVWRLNAYQSSQLEHPAHDEGKFTFYKLGTQEAQSAQLSASDPNLGLIKVTFTPEKEVRPATVSVGYSGTATYRGLGDTYSSDVYSMPKGIDMSFTSQSRSSGGTGLSGHSNQQYGQAAEIEYDYSGQTVIHLRLVCKDDDGVRPLTQYSTPVPPRI